MAQKAKPRKHVKRRKKTRKGKKRHLSSGPVRRRLADAFTPAGFKATLTTMGGGALSAAPVIVAEEMGIDNLKPAVKGTILYGLSFGAGIMGKYNYCAGIAAATTYKLYKDHSSGLSEGNSRGAQYTKELMQLPLFLNEDNVPMQLSQGDYMLSESTDMMLSELYGSNAVGPQF